MRWWSGESLGNISVVPSSPKLRIEECKVLNIGQTEQDRDEETDSNVKRHSPNEYYHNLREQFLHTNSFAIPPKPG